MGPDDFTQDKIVEVEHANGPEYRPAITNKSDLAAETVGHARGEISVEISTRFLEHFSEQLYSSPQKAFEELVSNAWDAGATFVDITVPTDLNNGKATLTVFDNGTSMDEQGLRDLWKIAFSPKEHNRTHLGRPVVGKFGIGKLSTYVLSNRLTYICKSQDGVVRRVTMDYGSIEKSADPDKLVSDLSLDLFELSQNDLDSALHSIDSSGRLKGLVDGKSKRDEDKSSSDVDEFGSRSDVVVLPSADTWTLVVLSSLKPTGQNLQVGRLRRMLESALPMSSEITIKLNDEILRSSKLDAKIFKSWIIGKDLGFSDFDFSPGDERDVEKISISTGSEKHGGKDYFYVEIPEVGRVSGTITLYEDKISGGKAEERGFSNGYLVNVLGRVVNQDDPSFGADNHSHAAWSRFRMAVRADDLNGYLITNREQFRNTRPIKIFRAFLRKCFNQVRSAYDSFSNVDMPDGGDVLVKSLGVVSLSPLRSAVSEALRTQPQLPGLFDETGIVDREKSREEWRKNTSESIGHALEDVKYESWEGDDFVKFRLKDSTIVVNRKHPFVIEHSRTRAEKELIRTIAMVNFLSDVYALEAGIEPGKLDDVRSYRDRLMRFRALQRRQSGAHIAQILLKTQNNSAASTEMEVVLGDALQYIGFSVVPKGGPGEPEGIASATLYGNDIPDKDRDDSKPLYKFTYDAKSSKHANAKTGNLSLDAINEHRERYKADYAIVVAPGFQDGAVLTRCNQLGIMPIRAESIGRLLELTAESGALPLDQLRSLFELRDPDEASTWIEAFADRLRKGRILTINVFLDALEHLRGKVPDVLDASTISYVCRYELKIGGVRERDVIDLVKGLSILVPDLIGLTEKEKIVVNASPARVAEAVKMQLENIRRTEGPGSRDA